MAEPFVSVVELDRSVLVERRHSNSRTDLEGVRACLFVSVDERSPTEFYGACLRGEVDNALVQRYGLSVRFDLCPSYARVLEIGANQVRDEVAEDLRQSGYAVWAENTRSELHD